VHRDIKLVPLVEPIPEETEAVASESSKKLQDLLG
jgi:hypothetical protein